jgi:hypothetical protein
MATVSSERGTKVVLDPATEVQTSGSVVESIVPSPTPDGSDVISYGAGGQSGGGSVVEVAAAVVVVDSSGADVVVESAAAPPPHAARIKTPARRGLI